MIYFLNSITCLNSSIVTLHIFWLSSTFNLKPVTLHNNSWTEILGSYSNWNWNCKTGFLKENTPFVTLNNYYWITTGFACQCSQFLWCFNDFKTSKEHLPLLTCLKKPSDTFLSGRGRRYFFFVFVFIGEIQREKNNVKIKCHQKTDKLVETNPSNPQTLRTFEEFWWNIVCHLFCIWLNIYI